jgi:hypothetical protein
LGCVGGEFGGIGFDDLFVSLDRSLADQRVAIAAEWFGLDGLHVLLSASDASIIDLALSGIFFIVKSTA